MQENKSFVYTMILGVCMLISLLLIAHMLLSGSPAAQQPQLPEQEEGADGMIEISGTQLADMIADSIPISVQSLALEIDSDGSVMVQGTVKREEIREYMEDGALRTMLMFLPESCELELSCNVELADGTLALHDASANVAGVAVPERLMEMMVQQVNASVNASMQEYGIDAKGISFAENKIIIT